MEEKQIQNYAAAEQFLAEVPKFTKKNLLEDTKKFYQYIQSCADGRYCEERLGKIVHVAGTNGKGSVCAYLQSICKESGYRTGMFTSPHLMTTRERFCIDGSVLSEEEFLNAFRWLSNQITAYQRATTSPSRVCSPRLCRRRFTNFATLLSRT